ncbi:heterokaryon incompatibility protein-domain-containing protein [Stachybotrys elegans]|uniref:Heterokaryon incompatibility protein-domain-containing protein n=1 Tax=Stachybotrys elegans TaxID=80388 RepID=A0A8K0SKT2_9HYPO|nr:heterokaryon incompatibility protein-domain-containing protein [Stachybotrys elegans]
MSQQLYTYSKLTDPAKDIRLVTILPGGEDDGLKLRITHVSLERLDHRHEPARDLDHARESFPEGWEAYKSLEGRILYIHKQKSLILSTTWQHPNSSFTPLEQSTEAVKGTRGQGPTYEALSYIWGVENDPLEVLIDLSSNDSKDNVAEIQVEVSTAPLQYASLSVRQNLEGSLRHLRSMDSERVVWIDAICINQADVVERNAQVSRIGDIFKKAERVIVWVGPSTDDSQVAIQTLDYIGKQVVSTTDRRLAPAPDASEKTWYESSVQLPFDDKTWAAINSLLRRPWFERLWVVQEAHLARRGLFLCGEDELDWMTFRYAILALWYNKAASWTLPPVMRLIGNLVELLPEKHPISDIFYQVYNRSCTDPRDRVYGLHGLFPPSFKKLIPPDYTLSVGNVYRDVTIAHINYSKRLEFLRRCLVEKPEEKTDPSWVPDLSSNLKITRRMDWQFAAGHSRCEVSFDMPNQLNATGICCATITDVHPPLPPGVGVVECISSVRGWASNDLDSGTYVTGGSIREAHARTLTGNALNDRFPARDYAGSFDEWLKQNSPTALFGERASTPLSSDSNPTPMEKLALSLLPGRAWFMTEEGYFGLAPRIARAGDMVVVFLGCESPILVRPRPNKTFQVLGECFVYGLNDANALLGPLPSPWSAHVFDDPTGLFTILRFYNSETKTTQDEDPRLGPLAEEWEAMERKERTSEDPRIFAYFMNKKTGEIVNSDPRMEPQVLRERGVELETFALI